MKNIAGRGVSLILLKDGLLARLFDGHMAGTEAIGSSGGVTCTFAARSEGDGRA
ncbi:hypothetical protein ASZ90_010782 [hydrocarbon metagenome]|uniref:Uncharacterized protein n=1 Tax=hydrocarbon metagenome TaxID=938273 RepID=A0A0W8FF08_9ZZZZ|nr:hypothetical protein [Methanomicrobiaceae archaeon]